LRRWSFRRFASLARWEMGAFLATNTCEKALSRVKGVPHPQGHFDPPVQLASSSFGGFPTIVVVND